MRMVRPPQREAREGAKADAAPKASARTTAESFITAYRFDCYRDVCRQTTRAGLTGPIASEVTLAPPDEARSPPEVQGPPFAAINWRDS